VPSPHDLPDTRRRGGGQSGRRQMASAAKGERADAQGRVSTVHASTARRYTVGRRATSQRRLPAAPTRERRPSIAMSSCAAIPCASSARLHRTNRSVRNALTQHRGTWGYCAQYWQRCRAAQPFRSRFDYRLPCPRTHNRAGSVRLARCQFLRTSIAHDRLSRARRGRVIRSSFDWASGVSRVHTAKEDPTRRASARLVRAIEGFTRRTWTSDLERTPSKTLLARGSTALAAFLRAGMISLRLRLLLSGDDRGLRPRVDGFGLTVSLSMGGHEQQVVKSKKTEGRNRPGRQSL